MAEFCNPLDIGYKYQHYGKSAHREGADPTLILFKGKYYLFADDDGHVYLYWGSSNAEPIWGVGNGEKLGAVEIGCVQMEEVVVSSGRKSPVPWATMFVLVLPWISSAAAIRYTAKTGYT